MYISRFAVRRPVIIGMVLIALAVFGLYSLTVTNVEFVGRVELPQLFVVAVWPGASSNDMEKGVIDILEDNFVTLEDFKSISSSSSNSLGIVTITFGDGIDPNDKIQEVRERLREMESSLPSDMPSLPLVIVGGASMLSTATFAVYGGSDPAGLSKYVDDTVKPRLTQIDGVSKIEVKGAVEPRVEVRMRVKDLEARGVNPLAVYQMLSASNTSIPLGTGEYEGKAVSVRYDGSFSSLADLESLPVGASDDGRIIRLSDVADISLGYGEKDLYITNEGNDVIVVDVFKRSDGNAIRIATEIVSILEELEASSGGAVSFQMIAEDRTTVENSMKTVIESGVMGIIIAVLIIFLFLNDGMATLVIGLSIPLSIFFTFIGMKLMGITVNLLSISGVVVALGSIVDASIVVLDEVYRFYQMKKDGKALYSVTESIDRGCGKVGSSVLGSNLTTVVVFIPVAMLTALIGQILGDLSRTFMVSIFSSLIVALVFVPWMLKKFLREGDEWREMKRKSLVVRGVDRLEGVYGKALESVLKDPLLLFIIAIGILVITAYTIPQQQLSFIPSTDGGDFYVSLRFPYGTTLEETRKGVAKAEELVLGYLREDDVRTYLTYAGAAPDTVVSFRNDETAGGLHVMLVDVSKRDWDIHSAISDLQYMLEREMPGVTVSVTNGGFDRYVSLMSGGGGFSITITGGTSEELYREAERIRDFLRADSEVVGASISADYDSMSAVLNANYTVLSSLGLTSYEAGMTNAVLFNGLDVGTYTDGATRDRYTIRLSSDVSDYPLDASLLSSIKVSGRAGAVSDDTVTDLLVVRELSQISHTDRAPSMTVNAVLVGESATSVQTRFKEYLTLNPLPQGMRVEEGGLGKLVADSILPVARALAIGIFLVYAVMVIVFERFNQPLQIMATVPFCIIGVTFSLTLFNTSFSMVATLGVVSLSGMLVNNGIILIDSINQLYREGRRKAVGEMGIAVSDRIEKELDGIMGRENETLLLHSAVLEGTVSRLRPILMSSLTTILGVIPMALANGEGAEIYAPLGQVIMGGLATSMVITLFITPTIFFVVERGRIGRVYRKKEGKEER